MGTAGRHLAQRLVQIGATDVFGVPGDFNLLLLDELISEPKLNFIGCCNELNSGYAADGYARARGVGACAVTFTVGALSMINAIAGSYSENLPVICIVGGPNSNDYGSNRILHHTIGHPDFTQELNCFKQVTCAQVVVKDLEDAHELIDYAISTALRESKPVYISISCNIAATPHPSLSKEPVPYCISEKLSNQNSLHAAVEAAADFLNSAAKPVLIGGPKMRFSKAGDAFLELANASKYAVSVMPSAKGLFPESNPCFIGTYWGAVSSPCCCEIVESADAYLFAGPIFNDYSSVGYSLLIKKEKAIFVQPERVTIGGGRSFGCVLMKDFLSALARKVKKNTSSLENFQRLYVPLAGASSNRDEKLRVTILFKHIQQMLSTDTAVICETGDSWFNCQKLKLPDGCGYEFQMQYGSIGWSVGALLGYAQGVNKSKRVIACIGDGSFQVTAQDVSTMIRNGQNSIIFLINNGGYTIEVEIHDGPYNAIKNWDYVGLVDAFRNGDGKCWTTRVTTEAELLTAIEAAQTQKQDHLCFIECILHRDDTSKELLEWGSRVAAANSRPPNPH